MQKFPDIPLEDGMTLCQCEQNHAECSMGRFKNMLACHSSWKRSCYHWVADSFTSARRFPCHPPPIPKMRIGIFIPVNVTELAAQWNYYLYLSFIMAFIIMIPHLHKQFQVSLNNFVYYNQLLNQHRSKITKHAAHIDQITNRIPHWRWYIALQNLKLLNTSYSLLNMYSQTCNFLRQKHIAGCHLGIWLNKWGHT